MLRTGLSGHIVLLQILHYGVIDSLYCQHDRIESKSRRPSSCPLMGNHSRVYYERPSNARNLLNVANLEDKCQYQLVNIL